MLTAAVALLLSGVAWAQNNSLSLSVSSSSGNATSPLQYGVMFEDINHSGDGGIYAELIQNRAFQGNTKFPSTLRPWTAVNGATLTLQNTSTPLSSALPVSVNVAGSANGIGISNPGYYGIDVKPQTYTGSFYVSGSYSGSFSAALTSTTSGNVLASAEIPSESVYGKWTQHNFTLNPTTAASDVNNTFSITFDGGAVNGSLNFNLISLFPPTYNNRPNGLRVDLMEALKGLNPSFLRFPGGNNLEGNDPPYRWKWNETIGRLTDRPGRPGTWGYENTDGLGLVEYLEWCEDLSLEPILAVWAGEYLDGTITPEDALQPYIDDALNELEFIMGDPSTTYGSLRVSLGLGTAPLAQIRYLEIGNEDNLSGGQSSYNAYRFPLFYSAIKAAYPSMNVIASTPDLSLPGDALSDFHEYARPDTFVSQFNMFDQGTPQHRTLIGEYATLQYNIPGGGGANFSAPRAPFPFWIGSVAEAVFLLGAERNAASILGASYAPTLQNLASTQWVPDLISYTAEEDAVVKSTSWQMIALLSGSRIGETREVSVQTEGAGPGPVFWVAGTRGAGSNSSEGGYIFKAAVYNATSEIQMSVSFPAISPGATATLTVLTAPSGPLAYNQPGEEDVVSRRVESVVATAGQGGNGGNGTEGVFVFGVQDLSVLVLELD